MFTKTRQLVLMGQNDDKKFVEIPGWLYHYEPFGMDIFIHHRVVKNIIGCGYRLEQSWRASDISTGSSLSKSKSSNNSRKEVVEALHERLSSISLEEYNRCVWNALTKLPPHKPTWRIDSVYKYAVKVHDENTQ